MSVLQAVVLSEYLAERPELVKNKRVLELGAGTGLVGMVAAVAGVHVVYRIALYQSEYTVHVSNAYTTSQVNAFDPCF
jgi:predicted nicotinamide N-methyase